MGLINIFYRPCWPQYRLPPFEGEKGSPLLIGHFGG